MRRLISPRGGADTWEYEFPFGGGNPPWASGLSQATAIEAYTNAATSHARPKDLELALSLAGLFNRRTPVGVRIPLGTRRQLVRAVLVRAGPAGPQRRPRRARRAARPRAGQPQPARRKARIRRAAGGHAADQELRHRDLVALQRPRSAGRPQLPRAQPRHGQRRCASARTSRRSATPGTRSPTSSTARCPKATKPKPKPKPKPTTPTTTPTIPTVPGGNPGTGGVTAPDTTTPTTTTTHRPRPRRSPPRIRAGAWPPLRSGSASYSTGALLSASQSACLTNFVRLVPLWVARRA